MARVMLDRWATEGETMQIDSDAIYLTDNGRALCGDHLGMTAKHTGYDISGQPIHKLTPAEVRYSIAYDKWHPSCEECHKEAACTTT